MVRDPTQVHSLAANPNYRWVKAFLRTTQLLKLEVCHGSACGTEIPADPAPLGAAASHLSDRAGTGKPRHAK